MTPSRDFFAESAEDLYENAPCGHVSTTLDGMIVRTNRTFESWTGFSRQELVGAVRFQELLSTGGQIYYETHYAPLLRMQGTVRGVAVDLVRADGSVLSALINSDLRHDEAGEPHAIRTAVFDAGDRRRYERELLDAREREREIAQGLQRSLLSGSLPSAERLELGAAYRSGVRTMDVGGDWHDAFWLSPGETVQLVVGDVVGRGIDAAATMGQLRSATRAFASTAQGPGSLLDALDEYARRHDVGQTSTLVCAEVNLTSGLFGYACAGHPPPVIARPGEAPRLGWEGRSPPLAANVAGLPRRPEASCELEPSSLVVLYTDGLIERRRRPIDEGIERLLREVAAQRDRPASALAAGLLDALGEGEKSDDVCILVARLG